MSEWISALILGVIEGVTEFLPVSSTGHLLIAEQWLRARSDLFNTVIQCGAVLAVLVVFSKRVQEMVANIRDGKTQRYVFKLALAFAITGAGGLLLKSLDWELPETAGPVAVATLIGGIAILAIENWLKGRPLSDEISWPIAIAVGLAQLLAAVFPGTSRSGATILCALAMGASRPVATEFSFLLGIPTLLSAGALQLYSAHKHGQDHAEDWSVLIVATLVAALTAFAAVKWLLRFVQSHTFIGFGWYRIGLGALILLLFWT